MRTFTGLPGVSPNSQQERLKLCVPPSSSSSSSDLSQVKSLFEMLYQLATTPDNDANIAQLIMTIAPAIYKPLDTSYMSIRHMELLKHIRPILQFLTEHHAEILRVVGPSKYQSTSAETIPSNITERLQQLQKISTTGGPKIPINVPSLPSPASSFPSSKQPPPNLSLHIHSTMEVEGADNVTHPNPYPEDLLNLSTHIAAHPPNYHSQEWKILEVLATSRLDLWLRQGYIGSNSLWDTDMSSQRTPHSTSRRNSDDLRLYDSDDEEPSSAKEGKSKREPSQHKRGRGDSRRGDERRALVAECKSLRHEVSSPTPLSSTHLTADPSLRRENEI
jgi:hypothetical protein